MKTLTPYFIVILFLFASCSSNESDTSIYDEMEMSTSSIQTADYGASPPPPAVEEVYIEEMHEKEIAAPRTSQPPAPPHQTPQKRIEKIIKNGYMEIEVPEIQAGKNSIDQKLKAANAYYEVESFNASDYQSTYSLTIRIPSDKFDSFIKELESGEGKILSKQVNSQNVTGEYYDIQVALKNKETYLEQYRVLLKKTGSVKDLLEVQERIRRLSEEMDVSKGRLAYMNDKVGMSTLQLTLTQRHERIISKPSSNIRRRIANAFQDGVDGVVSLAIGLIAVWPFILLIMMILIFRKRIIGLWR